MPSKRHVAISVLFLIVTTFLFPLRIHAREDDSPYFESSVGKYRFLPDLTRIGWTLSTRGTSSLSDTDQFLYAGILGSASGQLGILWHPIQNSSPTEKLEAMLVQYRKIYQRQNPEARVSIAKAAGSDIPMPADSEGVRGSYIVLIDRFGSLKESRLFMAVIEKSNFLYTIVLVNPYSSGNLPAQLQKARAQIYETTFELILKSLEITR